MSVIQFHWPLTCREGGPSCAHFFFFLGGGEVTHNHYSDYSAAIMIWYLGVFDAVGH